MPSPCRGGHELPLSFLGIHTWVSSDLDQMSVVWQELGWGPDILSGRGPPFGDPELCMTIGFPKVGVSQGVASHSLTLPREFLRVAPLPFSGGDPGDHQPRYQLPYLSNIGDGSMGSHNSVKRTNWDSAFCFKHIFALMTIYTLFVPLLIQGGKEVVFPNSKRIWTVLIRVEFIITRSIKPVLVD